MAWKEDKLHLQLQGRKQLPPKSVYLRLSGSVKFFICQVITFVPEDVKIGFRSHGKHRVRGGGIADKINEGTRDQVAVAQIRGGICRKLQNSSQIFYVLIFLLVPEIDAHFN